MDGVAFFLNDQDLSVRVVLDATLNLDVLVTVVQAWPSHEADKWFLESCIWVLHAVSFHLTAHPAASISSSIVFVFRKRIREVATQLFLQQQQCNLISAIQSTGFIKTSMVLDILHEGPHLSLLAHGWPIARPSLVDLWGVVTYDRGLFCCGTQMGNLLQLSLEHLLCWLLKAQLKPLYFAKTLGDYVCFC